MADLLDFVHAALLFAGSNAATLVHKHAPNSEEFKEAHLLLNMCISQVPANNPYLSPIRLGIAIAHIKMGQHQEANDIITFNAKCLFQLAGEGTLQFQCAMQAYAYHLLAKGDTVSAIDFFKESMLVFARGDIDTSVYAGTSVAEEISNLTDKIRTLEQRLVDEGRQDEKPALTARKFIDDIRLQIQADEQRSASRSEQPPPYSESNPHATTPRCNTHRQHHSLRTKAVATADTSTTSHKQHHLPTHASRLPQTHEGKLHDPPKRRRSNCAIC